MSEAERTQTVSSTTTGSMPWEGWSAPFSFPGGQSCQSRPGMLGLGHHAARWAGRPTRVYACPCFLGDAQNIIPAHFSSSVHPAQQI